MSFFKSNNLTNVAIATLYATFILFTILHFIIPFTHEAGSLPNVKLMIKNNDPTFNFQQIPSPLKYLDSIYIIGHYTCHQRNERSFFLKNNQLPICSRCLGIYIGMSFVFIIAILRNPTGSFFQSLCKLIKGEKNPDPACCDVVINVLLGVLLSAPMMCDGVLQIFTTYVSNNIIRFVTGVLFGVFEGGCIIGIISHIMYIYKYQLTHA
jgi:uncharacterized membrane protein